MRIEYTTFSVFVNTPDMVYYNTVGDDMKEWYEVLRGLREDRDLKQADVARLLGTTQQVYSRYENGINEIPLRHIVTLCRFYRVSADYILGLSEQNKA